MPGFVGEGMGRVGRNTDSLTHSHDGFFVAKRGFDFTFENCEILRNRGDEEAARRPAGYACQ